MDGDVGDHSVSVPQTGSSDPLARPGDGWLGHICPKHITARTDARCQLKNCRAGAATDIEYAFARLGRGQIQQLLRQSGNRTIHSLVLVGPRPRGGAGFQNSICAAFDVAAWWSAIVVPWGYRQQTRQFALINQHREAALDHVV
jgi:hypothetical protein